MKKPEPSKFKGKALLKGKKCVVTGGALGIGAQICYTFAENEAEVIILDFNQEAAENTKSFITAAVENSKVHFVQADVSDRAELKKSFDEVASIFDGSMDVFVNNVGIIQPCRIEDIILDEESKTFDRIIDVNIKGTYYCAAYAYPLLVKGIDPVFILIGSCASVGSEGQGGYAGTKAAQRGLLGTLAKEWKATEDYQDDYDDIGDFIAAALIQNDEVDSAVTDVWKCYLKWCENEAIKYPLGKHTFVERLRSRGFKQKNTRRNLYNRVMKCWINTQITLHNYAP